MQTSNSTRRILRAAAILVALGALALAATACSSAAQSPISTVPAAPAQPTAAAPAAATAAAAPTTAQGRAVVKSSCIGQCHGANILNYRASQPNAQRIAQSMGRRAGLPADKQQAVASFFAQ